MVLMLVYQTLAVADKDIFQNCLVAMRPKATCLDLPSIYDVGKHLHNEFIAWLEDLKNDITVSNMRSNSVDHVTHYDIQSASGKISTTTDGWTADNTKGSFLGMTAYWINIKGSKWNLRLEVIRFQAVSGEHSGWNLGCYSIGLYDYVGICNNDNSKVWDHYLIWLVTR